MCLRCLLHHILSFIAYTFRESRDFVFIIIVQIMIMQIFGYVLACRSCSFVCTLHHLIIIIVQTYLRTLNLWNACQVYFVECVSKIKPVFSVIHHTKYMELCVFSLPISLVKIERIYTLSYYHHQIGSMNYYPLFRVRSWNNGMRCMSLYILSLMGSCCIPRTAPLANER